MRFCITDIYFGPRLNKKVEELHEQFREMEMLVIPSEEVYSELVDDIKNCVRELNTKYPKSKALEVTRCNGVSSRTDKEKHIFIGQRNSESPLLSFIIKKIRGTYDGKQTDNANFNGLAPER